MSTRLRTRRLLLAIGNVLRGVLLIAAIGSIAAYYALMNGSALAGRLDAYLLSSYEGGFSVEFEKALSLYNRSKAEEAERAIEALLKKMGPVRKQDRLAPLYSRSVDLLITIAEGRGDTAKALALSKALTDLDGNNYNNWLNYAYHLKVSGNAKEAIDALYRSFRIAPHLLEVAEPLATVLMEEGRAKEARVVLERFMDANRGGNIDIFYAGEGEEFTPSGSTRVQSVAFTGRTQSFRIPVSSPGVTRLRINLPAMEELNVKVESFGIVSTDGEHPVDFIGSVYNANDVRAASRDTLAVTGRNPFVEISLPGVARGKDIKAVELRAVFTQDLPARLRYVARGL